MRGWVKNVNYFVPSRKGFLLSIVIILLIFCQNSLYADTVSNSYDVYAEIPIGGSGLYYVNITGAPSDAVITSVEARFTYIAYGVVQNYVSCQLNRGSDPGSSGGATLVSQGSLPAGNPGTYGYISFSNWNGQSVNTNYYFRFFTASGPLYAPTINTIYIRVNYSTPPDALSLYSPSDYYIKYNQTPYSFDWSSPSGATGYRIYVDNNSGFGSPEINEEPTNSELTSNTSLPNNVYYWKVQAKNSSGQWSEWSPFRRFVVDMPPPAPPLSSPADGTQYDEGDTASFNWFGPSGYSIDRYYIRIVKGTDLNNSPEYDYEGNVTSRSVDLTGWDAGTYTWGVRAIKNHPSGFSQSTYESTIGWGGYSTRQFDIVPGAFDLTASIDSSSLPESAQQGSIISVTCTVNRTGSLLPLSGQYVRTYLYVNQSPTSLIGAIEICGEAEQFDFQRSALDDGSETLSKDVTIPTNIEGPFYIHAYVDGSEYWSESDETNNLASSNNTTAIWRSGMPPGDEPLGVVVRTWDNPDLYWIKYNKKWRFLSQEIFFGLGYSDAQVQWYGSGALDGFTDGKDILNDNDGFCYRSSDEPTVFVIECGEYHPFFQWDNFLGQGFSAEDVFWTSPEGLNWIQDQSRYPQAPAPMMRVEPDNLNF